MRRSDKDLIEEMLKYLNGIKSTVTEGEFAKELNVNSETARKWLEIFLLIKKKCPDFEYRNYGRYRIIDTFHYGSLRKDIAQAELNSQPKLHQVVPFEKFDEIELDLKMIASKIIKKLKFSDISDWKKLIDSGKTKFSNFLKTKVVQLSISDDKDEKYKYFSNQLKLVFGSMLDSVEILINGDSMKPKLELNDIKRDFIQKIAFIMAEYVEYIINSGRLKEFPNLDKRPTRPNLRKSVMSELKISFDQGQNYLKKLDFPKRTIQNRVPLLSCDSCSFDLEFPTHCSEYMEIDGDNLKCIKCQAKISIPRCENCEQKLIFEIKAIE